MVRDIRNFSPAAQRTIAKNAEKQTILRRDEVFWRDKQPFFFSRGYQLRPRYCPGWVPSWTLPENKFRHPRDFEDFTNLPVRPMLIDATRVSDGLLVYIKRVPAGSKEITIAQTLLSPELNGPNNHTVPLLDVLQDDIDPKISYIVMPFLRLVNNPPFETVENVVDFLDQLLEYLCMNMVWPSNIMMDANALYPDGFHPVLTNYDAVNRRTITPLPRTGTSIRYYFVDFGISTYFPSDEQTRLVVGDDGHDQEVPELSSTIPSDPFKVDVFIIGNLLRKMFLEAFTNLGFLRPLIEGMTRVDPSRRHDASCSLKEWRDIRSNVSDLSRSWRLKPKEEIWPQMLVKDSLAMIEHGAQAGKSLWTWFADLQG